MKYGDSFDENVDLVGLGVANAAAGITGTFVVNGSPTKTEMVDSAGGRSQVSQLTAGVIVAVVLLFLTGPLAYMPNAVLAVGRLPHRPAAGRLPRDGRHRPPPPGRVRRRPRSPRRRSWSSGWSRGSSWRWRSRSSSTSTTAIARTTRCSPLTPDGTPGPSPLAERAEAAPGLAIYRFGASLYYANGSRFTEEIMDVVEGADPPLRWLGVSGSSIGDIDYSGADTIRQVKEELARTGVTFAICDLNPKVRGQLDAYGLTETDRRRPDLRHRRSTCWRPTAPRRGLPIRTPRPPPGRRRRKAERGHVAVAIARRAPAGRRRGPGPGAAGGPRGLAAGARPAGPGRAPRGAGRHPGAGPRADPLRADGGLAVHVLPGSRAADGGRPRDDAGQRHRSSSSAATPTSRTSASSRRRSATSSSTSTTSTRRSTDRSSGTSSASPRASSSPAAPAASPITPAATPSTAPSGRTASAWRSTPAMRAIDVYYARVDVAGILAYVDKRARPFLAADGRRPLTITTRSTSSRS